MIDFDTDGKSTGYGDRALRLTHSQESTSEHEQCAHYTQCSSHPKMNVSRHAVHVDESGVNNKSSCGRYGGRQGNSDQYWAHVLVADGEAGSTGRFTHTDVRQPVN